MNRPWNPLAYLSSRRRAERSSKKRPLRLESLEGRDVPASLILATTDGVAATPFGDTSIVAEPSSSSTSVTTNVDLQLSSLAQVVNTIESLSDISFLSNAETLVGRLSSTPAQFSSELSFDTSASNSDKEMMKQKIRNEIADLKSDLLAVANQIDKYIKEYRLIQTDIDKLDKRLRERENELDDKKNQAGNRDREGILRLQGAIEELKQQIGEKEVEQNTLLEKAEVFIKKYNDIHSQIEEKFKELGKLDK